MYFDHHRRESENDWREGAVKFVMIEARADQIVREIVMQVVEKVFVVSGGVLGCLPSIAPMRKLEKSDENVLAGVFEVELHHLHGWSALVFLQTCMR